MLNMGRRNSLAGNFDYTTLQVNPDGSLRVLVDRIDMRGATPTFQRELVDYLSHYSGKTVLLDFGDVEWIDYSVCAVLAMAKREAKRRGREFSVVNLESTRRATNVLEVSHLRDIFVAKT